jgi:Raf kinase inhibitor-like YbhB/YbcL family protein
MWQKLAPALLLIGLASCGARDHSASDAEGGGKVQSAALAKLSPTTTAFPDGAPIPAKFTCDGLGLAPAIQWTDAPQGTKSFALVVDDPDAPGGTFGHWGVYDIPASARSVGGDQHVGTEVMNDFGKPGYGAPCPPPGHGPHHYRFKLYALGTDHLGLPAGATVGALETAVRGHAIAQGQLVGSYERK